LLSNATAGHADEVRLRVSSVGASVHPYTLQQCGVNGTIASPMVTCSVCGGPAGFMAKHPEADLYRCRACTHCFSHPDSVEAEPYAPEYFDEHHQRWFAHPNTALFASIARRLAKGASVLDVGCGRGDFLKYLRRTRPDLKLTGIDLSRNDPVPGITFLQGDFLTTPIPEHFDAVVSLAVIEHFVDVQAFAVRLKQLVKPGGSVTVMTLNESSLVFALARTGKRIGVSLAFDRLYSRHHLHHFTRNSLRALMEGYGFEIESEVTHNAPLAAIDIPMPNRMVNAILRSGMWVLCQVGNATDRAYLQTVSCRNPVLA
jgi:2-polyprenyl-3-methyl-5-hydroxy-6-metoxy-1,4-benzoquinol methylase